MKVKTISPKQENTFTWDHPYLGLTFSKYGLDVNAVVTGSPPLQPLVRHRHYPLEVRQRLASPCERFSPLLSQLVKS